MMPRTTVSECIFVRIRGSSMRISDAGVRCAADMVSSPLSAGVVSAGVGDDLVQGPDVQDRIKNRIAAMIKKVFRFTRIRIPQSLWVWGWPGEPFSRAHSCCVYVVPSGLQASVENRILAFGCGSRFRLIIFRE